MNLKNTKSKDLEFVLAQNVQIGDVIANDWFDVYVGPDAIEEYADEIADAEFFTVVDIVHRDTKKALFVTFTLNTGEKLEVESTHQCHCGCEENSHLLKKK